MIGTAAEGGARILADCRANRIAAVDLGGTAIKAALIQDGEIALRRYSPTVAASRETVLDSLFSLLESLSPFDGVALSSAGDVDPYRGVCTFATANLPGFTGLKLKETLERRYGVPAAVINDGQAALLGEATAAGLTKPAAMLTLGTGVGGAFYDGQDIVFGKDFTFGRFGHLTLEPEGRPCTCGKRGCVEAYVSGSALKRTAQGLGLTPAELFASGRPDAAAAVEAYCRLLARALEIVHQTVSYETIILGGGVARSATLWLPVLQRFTQRTVEAAALGDDAGVLGAAAWYCRRKECTT